MTVPAGSGGQNLAAGTSESPHRPWFCGVAVSRLSCCNDAAWPDRRRLETDRWETGEPIAKGTGGMSAGPTVFCSCATAISTCSRSRRSRLIQCSVTAPPLLPHSVPARGIDLSRLSTEDFEELHATIIEADIRSARERIKLRLLHEFTGLGVSRSERRDRRGPGAAAPGSTAPLRDGDRLTCLCRSRRHLRLLGAPRVGQPEPEIDLPSSR